MALEGKIQIQSPIAPTNDNPRGYVTDNEYVKGAPQVFQTVADLVAFHPNRMVSGMPATVMNWPSAGTITDFRLSASPSNMIDATGATVVTEANFETYWVVQSQTLRNTTRVYQYAPNGPGGGAPVYPYTLGTEANWKNTYDASAGHKWLRFRDDDVDEDFPPGIFDNWSIPIGISAQFQTGDYVENRFKRQALAYAGLHSTEGGPPAMTDGLYYVVETGTLTIDATGAGTLEENDIGQFGTATQAILQVGRIFKYVVANHDYTFSISPACTLSETLKVPPRTISGLPNNEPAGWTDNIPNDTDYQLWQISGQKSVYGQLKTDWILKKINEDPNYIRYSNTPTPHPDAVSGLPNPLTSTTIVADDATDLALSAPTVGWERVYNDHIFIATREDTGGSPPYTAWLVEKINEESGEYTDRVFKLFDLNLDADSPSLGPPTLADATSQGWSDTPVAETATQVNYVSEARKFFNGELKTQWSQPVPYTGKSIFNDIIVSDRGDNFKYDNTQPTPNVVPDEITLSAFLYKGLDMLHEDPAVTITYAWQRVYDDGAPDTTSPGTSPATDFYRPAIVNSGQCDAGGNATTLIDAGVDFVALAVEAGHKVWNRTDGSVATVVSIASTTLTTTALTGGTANTWANTNDYVLEYENGVYNYYQTDQRVVVKSGAVNGNAIFRCTQKVTLPVGDDLVFEEEFSILDVTDGKDAISFSVTADTDRVAYDTEIAFAFNPTEMTMRAYWSNISPTLHWYRKNGANWDRLDTDPDYILSGNTAKFNPANIFSPDGLPESETYAASTIPYPGNPETADNITDFSDFITIVKLGSLSTGSAGADAISVLLDNEAHTVVLDSITLQPQAGETGAGGKATTLVQVYDGTLKKDYTTHWTITSLVSDEGADITFNHQANGTDREVYVDSSWLNGKRSAVCTISILYAGYTRTKKFTLTSTADATGSMILDINSNKGFEFTPQDKTAKTFSAQIFSSSLQGNQEQFLRATEATIGSFATNSGNYPSLVQDVSTGKHIILGGSIGPGGRLVYRYDGGALTNTGNYTLLGASEYYTFIWTANDSPGAETNDNQRVINQSDILVFAEVTVNVYLDSVLVRSRTISVSDVNDGEAVRAWTDEGAAKPAGAQLLVAQTTLPQTIGAPAVTWRSPYDAHWDSNDPWYAQDAAVDGVTYTWGKAYQLKGESGSQGPSGNFYHAMYKESVSSPPFGSGDSNTASLAAMITAGWKSQLPVVSGIIWRTERPWVGDGVTFNGAGDPSTLPVTGGVWTEPVQLSGDPGDPGLDGGDGDNGWSPIFAIEVVNPTTEVLKVTGWTGGSGTPPASGVYVGSSGFVGIVGLAVNIKGSTGQSGAAGGLSKYLVASGGSITSSSAMGNFQQGNYVDTGDATSKKLKIRAYVSAIFGYWVTLRITGSADPEYTGTAISTRFFHVQDPNKFTSQYQMDVYITTSQRYIGVTFSDSLPSPGYSAFYYDYGIEVFVIP